MVDSVEDRHPGEPAGGDCRADRLREDLAIDDARDGRGREVVHQVIDRQVAQAPGGLVRAAGGRRDALPERLGVGERQL